MAPFVRCRGLAFGKRRTFGEPMKKALLSAGVALTMCVAGFLIPVEAVSASAPPARPSAKPTSSDVREVSPDAKFSTKRLGLSPAQQRGIGPKGLATDPTPPVGTVRQWLGLDDFNGILYRKDYTLRGVGDHIEVWVANDRAFPAGDCRLQIPGSTDITDAQVARLVSEFDGNM